MNPEHLLATFRDSLAQPVQQWPKALFPSATVIVVEDLDASPWTVLIHQRSDNHHWGFLGGRQEIGESIAACAVRECHEESGLDVTLLRLTSVDSSHQNGAIVQYVNGPIQYTNVTFLATVLRGTCRLSDESLALWWKSIHDLPSPFLDVHLWRLKQAWLSYFEPKRPVSFR